MDPLHILIVEDSEDDAQLLLAELRRGGYSPVSMRVDTADAMRAALERKDWDLVVADYSMPHFSALAALELMRQTGLDLPFIIVSGTIGEETAVEAMRAGAHDYLMKGNLKRLVPAVQRELDEAQVRRERRRAYHALQESNRRLAQALEELRQTQRQVVQQERLHALQQMASGIVHDLNNLLAPILGFTELMLSNSGLRDAERLTHHLEMVKMAARDAAALVSRLREFYKPTNDADVVRPVDLNETFRQAVSLTQPKWKNQAQARGVTITMALDLGEVPPVPGNEIELREVIINLLLNAVDAMVSSGTITLRTWPEGGHAVLQVVDTGVGMTEEVRQRCMEPFFTTKGKDGTGLGLAMVYGIIQRHRGTIDIQSQVGRGTAITVRLPVAEAAGADMPAPLAGPGQRPLRVLVVDDSLSMREVLTEYLVSDHHYADTAANGAEALKKFSEAEYDVVVTGLAMLEMDGLRLAAAIKARSPETAVVLMSGFAEVLRAGGDNLPHVDFVIGKPVELSQLREALALVARRPPPRHRADGAAPRRMPT